MQRRAHGALPTKGSAARCSSFSLLAESARVSPLIIPSTTLHGCFDDTFSLRPLKKKKKNGSCSSERISYRDAESLFAARKGATKHGDPFCAGAGGAPGWQAAAASRDGPSERAGVSNTALTSSPRGLPRGLWLSPGTKNLRLTARSRQHRHPSLSARGQTDRDARSAGRGRQQPHGQQGVKQRGQR